MRTGKFGFHRLYYITFQNARVKALDGPPDKMLYNSAMDPERYGPKASRDPAVLIGMLFAAVSGALVGAGGMAFWCWMVGR